MMYIKKIFSLGFISLFLQAPYAMSAPAVPTLALMLGINTSVDMRSHDSPVMNQFGGTCSAFATAAAMNNVLKAKGNSKLVSERDLWSHYAIFDATYAIKAASQNYLTEAKYWPANTSLPTSNYKEFASLKVAQFKDHQYNLENALMGLSQGHPTVMAVRVPSGLANCDKDVSAKSAYTKGQHVLEAVGYKLDDSVSGGGYFILKNSWGTTCGDKGYHTFPFSLCKRSDLYCYFIEVIDVEDRS